MPKRAIVEIDESKCNGCGLCVAACAEGAIQIIDGKARLVSDVYCDGLGACLGTCPQDAIRIVQREAASFDHQAVERHLAALNAAETLLPVAHSAGQSAEQRAGGCPGLTIMGFGSNVTSSPQSDSSAVSGGPSALSNWPIQLKLVPQHASFLENADLLLAADCVPFALADFHQRFLAGRVLLVGCPKLDDAQFYVEKLTAVLRTSQPRSLMVLRMEVPCCSGLLRIAQAANEAAGTNLLLHEAIISIRGEVLGVRSLEPPRQ